MGRYGSQLMGIVPHLVTKPVSHSQQVCRLYKAGLKVCRSNKWIRLECRMAQVELRKRFDDNADIKDFRVAKELVQLGWEEHDYKRHWVPFSFPDSDGGVVFQRDENLPDFVLDLWHPLEKAFYPDYFDRREKRKQEFIDRWHKKYGTPSQEDIDEAIWFYKDDHMKWQKPQYEAAYEAAKERAKKKEEKKSDSNPKNLN